jgi:UDP-N-acetylmuramyl tripeptide synthase
MSFTVKMPSHTFPVKTHLFGAFNVSNILAAIAVLISQKIDTQAITHAVSELQGIA